MGSSRGGRIVKEESTDEKAEIGEPLCPADVVGRWWLILPRDRETVKDLGGEGKGKKKTSPWIK
jgi:hypothetical protein